jgi:hypothetical protein
MRPEEHSEPRPVPARWSAVLKQDAAMAARSNAILSALVSAVKLNPRLSAGLAFELGVMVGAFIKTARGRKGIAGATAAATAKLIEAVPIMPEPASARRTPRKAASRKRKTAKRAA